MPIDLNREWPPMLLEKLAETAGVHQMTVERWCDRGLEFVKLGMKRYTTRAAVDRFAVRIGRDEITKTIRDEEDAEIRRQHDEPEAELDRLGM